MKVIMVFDIDNEEVERIRKLDLHGNDMCDLINEEARDDYSVVDVFHVVDEAYPEILEDLHTAYAKHLDKFAEQVLRLSESLKKANK